MAPKNFVPGDLVLVNFPGYGYWPAQVTEILKNCQRKVKCFGKGENGYAQPKDMIHFNEETKKTHLSDNSWINDSIRKEALKQIETKYSELSLKKKSSTQVSKKTKKHDLQNNNNEQNGRNDQASGSSKTVHLPINDSTGKKKMSDNSTKQSAGNNNVGRNDKDAEKDKDPDTNVNVEALQAAKEATNEKQTIATQESKQLKNLEGKKRDLMEETVKRIKLEKELEKVKLEHKAEMKVIRDDHEEEIKDIRVEHKEEIKDIWLKAQADYEKKLQKSSDDYEKKIQDLQMRLEEELAAASSSNQKADNFKTDLENMSAKVASLEETKASLEDEVKTLTHALEESFAIHISSQLGQLQKEGPSEQVFDENTVGSDGKTRKRVEEEDGSDSREGKRMRVELEEDKSIVNEEGLVGEEKNDNGSRCRIM